MVLSRRLEGTQLTARDIRALMHDPEFQAITDRNAQLVFLKKYAALECGFSINPKQLASIYDISVGHVRNLLCAARKREESGPSIRGRPPILTEDQEQELVNQLRPTPDTRHFPTKKELLDEVERRYGKVLTYGWVDAFLARHREQITTASIHAQEEPRLQVPREYLNGYLGLILRHVVGTNPRLVYNIDETGCSDWEERKSYEGIVPVELATTPIHSGVTRRVKHQTLLVCINAAGEMLCPLIVSTDPATNGVFRDGIEEGVDLKVQIARSAYVDANIFCNYLRDVMIPKIEELRETNGITNEPAVLLIDNCSAHTSTEVIELLSHHRVKVITFPPHTTGIFQMLDLVFFGVFKRFKKHLARDSSIPMMADHAMRMFRACESAGASSTVRGSFIRAGFIYVRRADGTYSLGFDEGKIRAAPEFREVWDIDFPMHKLSTRRRNSRWGFLNENVFTN
jgi:transposase